MRKICHICGKTKYHLGGGEYICEHTVAHDCRPKLVDLHSVDRTMVIVGLSFKYGGVKNEN